MPRPLLAAAILVPLLALAAGGSTALADGDPASDTLVVENAYLPYPAPQKDVAAALTRTIETVYKQGYRIKVAVIATKTDLGAVPSLFNLPTDYAKFLGQELSYYYVGPLLIAMPAGFGIYDRGRSTAAEETVLSRMSVKGSSAEAVTQSATSAVAHLLAARALKSPDIRAPYAQPVDSSGQRGQPMKLQYAVLDDSGRSSVLLQVTLRSRVLKTFHVPLRRVKGNATYSVIWFVPKTLRGTPRLCVTATDPGGNRSTKSCIALHIL